MTDNPSAISRGQGDSIDPQDLTFAKVDSVTLLGTASRQSVPSLNEEASSGKSGATVFAKITSVTAIVSAVTALAGVLVDQLGSRVGISNRIRDIAYHSLPFSTVIAAITTPMAIISGLKTKPTQGFVDKVE